MPLFALVVYIATRLHLDGEVVDESLAELFRRVGLHVPTAELVGGDTFKVDCPVSRANFVPQASQIIPMEEIVSDRGDLHFPLPDRPIVRLASPEEDPTDER